MKKKKLVKISSLKTQLDKIFSQSVRLVYSTNGYCTCFTCGDTHHWKEIHCGHWISRQRLSTRWDTDNCRPQCAGCNLFGKITGQAGEPYLFAEALKSEGVDIERLLKRAKEPMKLERDLMQKWIGHFAEKVQKYA